MMASRSYWINHTVTWQASGLSRKAYATKHNLDFKSFGWWTWKLEQEGYGPYVKPPRPAKPDKTQGLKTKKIDPTTPRILELWAAGVPVEAIAAEVGKTTRAVQLLAAYHKVRRPAGYVKRPAGYLAAMRTQQVAA
jgi:hypothetical protein